MMNNFILVHFAEDKSVKVLESGHKLYIPTRSRFQEDTGTNEGTLTKQLTDRRLINPQFAKVLEANPKFPEIQKGDYVFTHYGAYEQAQPHGEDDIINATQVFFVTNEAQTLIRPVNGIYIGEEIYVEAERSPGGLYLTPEAEVKEKCKVKVLYAPHRARYGPGSTVATSDDKQYIFEFNHRKYVMLKPEYIVGEYI